MTDYSELKRLAEAALPYGADEKFEAAARPEAVLALIAENERLSGECEGCPMSVAEELRVERDKLKAENERLRLALESCADDLEAQVIQCYHGQPVEEMHPVTRRAYDRDMVCAVEARAAMSKADRSDG